MWVLGNTLHQHDLKKTPTSTHVTDHIPADVRRELRQEVNYGCAKCGAPIIDYHHIIPKNEYEHNNPEHMVALCPNHHRPSDDEAIERTELYQLKKNPHNESKVDHLFHFSSKKPEFRLAKLNCIIDEEATHPLLTVGEETLFSVSHGNNLLSFDMKIHDRNGELMAKITHNEWQAYTDQIWDLRYKSNELSLWDPNEELRLRLNFNPEDNLIEFQAKFYKNNESFKILPSKITASQSGTIKGDGEIYFGVPEGTSLFHVNDTMGDLKLGYDM